VRTAHPALHGLGYKFAATVTALRAAPLPSGRLNAAFDVFWHEPYQGPLLAYHPGRFLMTPHVAGSCREFLQAAAADLRAFVRDLFASGSA
jgi:phosphoglycerate dehydrogenase-like enzyme